MTLVGDLGVGCGGGTLAPEPHGARRAHSLCGQTQNQLNTALNLSPGRKGVCTWQGGAHPGRLPERRWSAFA